MFTRKELVCIKQHEDNKDTGDACQSCEYVMECINDNPVIVYHIAVAARLRTISEYMFSLELKEG